MGWKRTVSAVAGGVGVALVVAGCGTDGGSSGGAAVSTTTSASMAANAPTAFDPCKLPASVIAEEGFKNQPWNADSDGNGGIHWRGCGWLVSNGYSVSILTTNVTLAMIHANHNFTVSEEFAIAGRPALTYQQTGQTDTHGNCLLEAQMTGGSLELQIDNPPSADLTAKTPACDIAKKLAQDLIATFPPNA
ncbi:DUF3558 domain-containing protein [Nocardia stercoris]|uniref:DUF3558 domain-containing protein n=1 Tax=Nocardia stercoris TaxID=2483361 RepID=A0A3M2LGJ8_9NOCA|nr:DUF3558 domain-containing protein [Nocardia stercoris]RMI35075.1 DUF3558 domain-containing protein [Nocardia stercoris]